jgi:CRISPR-associated RAMP protein (TIGR02581 family)
MDLEIKPDGPILIKSGIETISGPAMAFVRTWRNGSLDVYLPGSSLKGVLRSHAERIARTLNRVAACDPFGKENTPEASCGACFEARSENEELDPSTVYVDSCPICKLFGTTWFASRLATEDAYATGTAPTPEQRDGVGIDRFTGGAAHNVKFDLEVVTAGTFKTRLHLRNFELWQLGLIGFVLKDLADGLVRIGASKSRGLGRVIGTVTEVRLDFFGPEARPANGMLLLKGVGSLVRGEYAERYRFTRPDQLEVKGITPAATDSLRTTYEKLPFESLPWNDLGAKWVAMAEPLESRPAMKPYRTAGGGMQ